MATRISGICFRIQEISRDLLDNTNTEHESGANPGSYWNRHNRAAIGTRIKIVTEEQTPRHIHRLVGSGSSFGGNPLQQTIGVGKANQVTLIIEWPTSKTTQVFHKVAVNRSLEITEFASEYQDLQATPLSVPRDSPK